MPEAKEKTNPQNSNELEKWEKIASLIGKMILAVGSIIYIFGLLVTNIYIGKLGSTTISLVKVNYLLTGVWALIPLCISTLVIGWIVYFIKPSVNWRQKVLVCIFVLFITIGIAIIIKALFTIAYEIKVNVAWVRIMCTSASIIVLVFLFLWMVYHRLSPKDGHEKRYFHLIVVSFALFMFVTIIMVYLNEFALNIYPLIPSYLGGAKSVMVQVFTDPNSEINNSFANCKLTQIGQGLWKGKLILVTDNEYLFDVNDANETLCIKKQDVKAIKYQRSFGEPNRSP